MRYRTLKESELSAWAEHCAQVFAGPTDTPEYFTSHYLNDPWRDPNAVFIAEEDGQIASTLRVFKREMWLCGERVPMGGIGEVCTKEQYRGQGLSGKLLQNAIEYMEAQNLAVSVLFTGINKHYARYGWFTRPQRRVRIPLDQCAALPEGSVLRPMTDADIPHVARLYRAGAPRIDGAVVRDHPDYWTNWARREWKRPHVLELDDRLIGYIDARIDEQHGLMLPHDFARAEDGPDCACLMAALAKATPGSPQPQLPQSLAPIQNGPFIENFNTMIRLNVPFTLRGQRIASASQLDACTANLMVLGLDSF